jgi:fatty-acyl-CoA synthase
MIVASSSWHLPAALATHGPALAPLVAGAHRFPCRTAWVDANGELSYRELQALVTAHCGGRRNRAGHRSAGLSDHADRQRVPVDLLAAAALGRSVFTTSGTTGAPRRVNQRAGPAALAQRLSLLGSLPVAPAPVVACCADLRRGHGFGVFMATMAVGGTFVVVDTTDDTALPPLIDVLSAIPVQLRDLLSSGRLRQSVVTTVVSGSDRLPAELAARLTAEWGAAVYDAYGPAERRVTPGTVGRPLAGVRISVRDHHGRRLTRGAAGVLHVRSAAGRQPFRGDLGRLTCDGLVMVDGRADDTLSIGGEVVSPNRLREWLSQIDGIVEVTVDSCPDARFGRRLIASVRVADGAEVDLTWLRGRARAELGTPHTPKTITQL